MIDVAQLSDAELEAIANDDRDGFTRAAAARLGVRPELALAVRQQESRGNPRAISPKGARGEMQLMPGTAAELNVDPDDPWDNITGGLTYLKRQIDDFGDERLGLAAYNAGPGAVREHGGVPPFAETQQYVASILGEGGQPAPEAAPDVSDLSDEELEAIANGAAPAGQDVPKPTAEIGDAQFVSAPKTAMNPKQSFVYADDQNPLTPGQARFYEGQVKAGKLDPAKARAGEIRAGSEEFPLAQRDPKDLPKPGDWYVTPEGEKKQVPPVPMLATAANAVEALANPSGTIANIAADIVGLPRRGEVIPDDARTQAIERGLMSGALLGGRNEVAAGAQSLPALLEGGVPSMVDRFKSVRDREDRTSAQSRRDFPLAYDAAAVGGALATAPMMPEKLLPRLALGAGAGFLSTDGGLDRRAVGAGVGALGGEVLRYVAPKVAGAVMDATGLPMRQPSVGEVPRSPLTNFPLDPPNATRPELRVGEAIRRAAERDEMLPPAISEAAREAGILPFQAGGDNLTGLAEVLAQSPGKGQSIIRNAVRDQQASVPGRVKGEIAKTFGGQGDYFEKLDAAQAARREEARAGMAQLQDHLVTLDHDSVLALRSDLARSAIKEQVLNSLASIDPETRAAGARLNRLHDDLLDKPSAQTITVRDAQNISKSLLDAADGAYQKGDPARARALKELGKSVRENAATPERGGFQEYGDWLKKYGEDSQGIEALELGRQVFGSSLDMSAERLRKTYAGWGETARENYRKGVGEALLDAVRRKGGVTEARQLLKNEEFADRIRVAVPDDMSFDDFMASLEREVKVADRNNRVVGGSPTYARQAARADLEAQARDPLDLAAEAIDTGLSPVRLTGKALKATLKALPRKDRSLIGDPAANAALARALTDDKEMTRLLNMLEHYKAARTLPMKGLPASAGGYIGATVASPRN